MFCVTTTSFLGYVPAFEIDCISEISSAPTAKKEEKQRMREKIFLDHRSERKKVPTTAPQTIDLPEARDEFFTHPEPVANNVRKIPEEFA